MATEDGRMELSTADQIDRLPGRVDALETIVGAIPITYQTIDNANAQNDALVHLIDNGAKNIANWSATTGTTSGVTFTVNDDKTVSTSGTASQRAQFTLDFRVPSTLPAGRYVLNGCPIGGSVGTTVKYCLYCWDQTANTRVTQNDTGDGVAFDWTPDSTHQYNIAVDVRAGNDASGLVFKPMICAEEVYNISNKFVPYVPTNAELYQMIASGTRSLSMSAAPQTDPEQEER